MKLIKLTSINGTGDLYVNPNHIGHCYRRAEHKENYQVVVEHSVVCVTTHNNGGLKVKQTPEQIIELIQTTRQLD